MRRNSLHEEIEQALKLSLAAARGALGHLMLRLAKYLLDDVGYQRKRPSSSH